MFRTLLRSIKEDFPVNSHAKSKFVIAFFRIAHASLHASPLVSKLSAPLRIAYRIIVDWVLGIDLPVKTKIGNRLVIYHGHALVVNEAAILGDDCILRHCVTIGNKLTSTGESLAPVIGDRVEFGAGCAVIGPIQIGDDVIIGALSVVTKSIDAGLTVVGNPARPLNR